MCDMLHCSDTPNTVCQNKNCNNKVCDLHTEIIRDERDGKIKLICIDCYRRGINE